MAHYTTELRTICERLAGYNSAQGQIASSAVIKAAIPRLFDFDFPIFDESYRSVLETKIVRHYYTREIGEETLGLWKFRLETRLNEVMPYYNLLYESAQLKYDPLTDVDYTTTHEGKEQNKTDVSSTEDETVNRLRDKDRVDNATKNGSTDGTEQVNISDTTNKSSQDVYTDTSKQTVNAVTSGEDSRTRSETDVYSDTPQGSLANVLNNEYLTNARAKNGSENGKSSGTSDTVTDFKDDSKRDVTGNETTDGLRDTTSHEGWNETDKLTSGETETENSSRNLKGAVGTVANTTEDYITHVAGKYPGSSYAKLVGEYRETLINVDGMIIEELADLFMNVW